MDRKSLTVQLVQVNFRYGDNAYLPYSIGLLESFVQASDISEKVKFRDAVFLRQPIEDLAKKLEGVDVLAISCYLWNWNWSLTLARKAKLLFPDLIIVVGGPQVPEQGDFLLDHPYINYQVINEGELVFYNLLKEILNETKDMTKIKGIHFVQNGVVIKNEMESKITNLDQVPSPYITGIFDKYMKQFKIQFQATQETHRGCPYSCTFCDWGSATMSKVRRFSNERILQEYEWFAKSGIELLYNADANYGLFKEDIELTEKLVETKSKYGYPKKFRAAYAKNSNDRVFTIAKILEDEQMCKGVTLSFQSMDTNVLDNIKRKNMKINNFRELITTYREAKIPTYTELIVGLPGETFKSFSEGVGLLFKSGQHDSLSIYNAMLLENSEMNKEEYKRLHGIQSTVIPLLLLHGSLEPDDVQEYYEVVIETATMPKSDWIRTTVFAWIVQAFHCLNLTQSIAVALHDLYKIEYEVFYQKLIEVLANNQGDLGELVRKLNSVAFEVAHGGGSLDLGDRTYGDIMWPVEEIVFLRAVSNVNVFTELYESILEAFPSLDIDELREIVLYQQLKLRMPGGDKSESHVFKADWHTFIDSLLLNQSAELVRTKTKIGYTARDHFTDIKDYAREVVWYGRKGSSLINPTTYSVRLA